MLTSAPRIFASDDIHQVIGRMNSCYAVQIDGGEKGLLRLPLIIKEVGELRRSFYKTTLEDLDGKSYRFKISTSEGFKCSIWDEESKEYLLLQEKPASQVCFRILNPKQAEAAHKSLQR